MLSVNFLFEVFLLVFIGVNLLGYEQHLFNNYSQIIILISVIAILSIHFLLFYRKSFTVYYNARSYLFFVMITYIVYLFFITFIQVLQINYVSYNQIIKLILNTFLLIYLYGFVQLTQMRSILKGFYYVGIILAILNILIMLNDGFFIWQKIYIIRGASWFYDPNFFAAFNLFLILFHLFYVSNRNITYYILSLLLITSLIFTFSKASVLSLTTVMFLYYFTSQRGLIRRLTYLLIAFIILIVIFYAVKDISGFRFSMGGNNRDTMAAFFLHSIIDNPFIGYGEKGIELQLLHHNLVNKSFHSFLLDKTYAYGILSGIFLLTIFSFTFIKLYKMERRFSWIWLGMIINSFFIDYSIGGYGSLSFILTTLFIYACRLSLKNFKVRLNEYSSCC